LKKYWDVLINPFGPGTTNPKNYPVKLWTKNVANMNIEVFKWTYDNVEPNDKKVLINNILSSGDMFVIQYILENDMEIYDNPVSLIIKSGHVDCLKYYIASSSNNKRGFNLHQEDFLISAIKSQNPAMFDFVYNADIFISDEILKTAFIHRNVHALKILMSVVEKIPPFDPIMFGRWRLGFNIVKWLISSVYKDPFLSAVRKNMVLHTLDIELLKLLYPYNVLNLKTILHNGFEYGRIDIIDFLILRGYVDDDCQKGIKHPSILRWIKKYGVFHK
jgi:hypothetical protein